MLENIFTGYMDYLKNDKGLSNNTLAAYKRDINLFRAYLKDIKLEKITEVNKTVIITYLIYLQKNGRAMSTISRNLSSIRSLYQYLLNQNLIREDPTYNLQSPKAEKKIPSILSKNEVDILLSLPQENNFKGARDRAMLELLYGTGIKVSEMVDLNLDNLNLEAKSLLIGNREAGRVIPLGGLATKYLIKYIRDYRKERLREKEEKALFLNYSGERLTRQGLWKIIKIYAQKSKLNKKITPHTLRHSFAVHLLENGADMRIVQEILGHSDISTTQVYSYVVNNKNIKDVYEKLHPRT